MEANISLGVGAGSTETPLICRVDGCIGELVYALNSKRTFLKSPASTVPGGYDAVVIGNLLNIYVVTAPRSELSKKVTAENQAPVTEFVNHDQNHREISSEVIAEELTKLEKPMSTMTAYRNLRAAGMSKTK